MHLKSSAQDDTVIGTISYKWQTSISDIYSSVDMNRLSNYHAHLSTPPTAPKKGILVTASTNYAAANGPQSLPWGGVSSTGRDRCRDVSSTGRDRCRGVSSTGTDRSRGVSSTGTDMCRGVSRTGTDRCSGVSSTGTDRCRGVSSTGTDRCRGVSSTGTDSRGVTK